MIFCDVTMAYASKSGGIKTYIDEKRRFLREHTEHEHVLIIPGARDRVRRSARSTTYVVKSPVLPGQDDYRFFISPTKIRRALEAAQPDAVELGSYYTEPWPAFAYRRRREARGRRCILGAYFHTDVAEAYVASPLRDTVGMERLAEVAAAGAARYVRHVFSHCDLVLSASPAQADRLGRYGVGDVRIAPMGVDLRQFHPRARSDAFRAEQGAGEGALVIAYAGRLCAEKRVPTLIEAFAKIAKARAAQLWIVGDGPLRPEVEAAASKLPGLRLFPYMADRPSFAEFLASADVYATAGPFETFALSVVEAQACGLPVVGVDAGALRERVADGLGYLGPVDDATAMAENILRANAERSALSANARAHAERNFSWTRAFRRWLSAYETVNAKASAARTPAPSAAADPTLFC